MYTQGASVQPPKTGKMFGCEKILHKKQDTTLQLDTVNHKVLIEN